MKQYVSFNISKKSDATTEYVLKMLSSIMETIIFMFMGLSTVSDHHSWNTGFVVITLLACLIFRMIGRKEYAGILRQKLLCLGIAIFANLANCWRLLELTRIDMLIMSYGGLRGAIAFALALILDETKIPRKKEFVTATIAVVFFTVFLQVCFTSLARESNFYDRHLGYYHRSTCEMSQCQTKTNRRADDVR